VGEKSFPPKESESDARIKNIKSSIERRVIETDRRGTKSFWENENDLKGGTNSMRFLGWEEITRLSLHKI